MRQHRDFNYGNHLGKQIDYRHSHSSKGSYAGLILLIAFVLGMVWFIGSSLYKPNTSPPEMNKKHRVR